MNEDKIIVAIVDDHTLFRDGLANLLKEYENIQVLFKATNGMDLQDQLNKRGVPDVVLMDINMPVMNGHDATAWLKLNFPLVLVLALSMYEDDVSIINMLKKGAGGYVLKECTADELVRAITSIKSTGYYINDLVSGRLIHSIREEEKGISKVKITDREKEFLQLCCSEFTYKEIAEAMKVSPRTIDSFRDVLFEKLEIRSRTGLVLYAIKNELVEL